MSQTCRGESRRGRRPTAAHTRGAYRGTSLIRNHHILAPYRRPYGGPREGGDLLSAKYPCRAWVVGVQGVGPTPAHRESRPTALGQTVSYPGSRDRRGRNR